MSDTPHGIVGRVYLERGSPVVVRVQWRTGEKGVLRNVLVERSDGSLVVRPFRGLRKPPNADVWAAADALKAKAAKPAPKPKVRYGWRHDGRHPTGARLLPTDDDEAIMRSFAGLPVKPRCDDCAHIVHVVTWRSVSQCKCALTDDGTQGTDIYRSWPACELWEAA